MKREVENEIEQADADGVSRLIGELKPADAPRNFERAVMARVAKGASTPRRIFGMSPAIAYALPLVLILLMGVAVFVATRQMATPQPDVAGPGPSQFTTNQTAAPPVASPSVEQTAVAVNPPTERKVSPPSEAPPPINSSTRKQTQRPGGGFTDEAVGEKRPIAPGTSNRPYAANRDEVISSNAVPVRDILATLGITAEFTRGWIVRGVTANSQAEHSGVRTGDVVVALGDTTLNANTDFKGQFSASSIRVRRGGQELGLSLK